MTHRLHGVGVSHANHNGFTALGKTIETRKSSPRDSEYVEEHSVLKYDAPVPFPGEDRYEGR